MEEPPAARLRSGYVSTLQISARESLLLMIVVNKRID